MSGVGLREQERVTEATLQLIASFKLETSSIRP